MKRLTTNKPVDEMSMLELAYNSCYVKDGKAMYQDFSFNTDARDLVRHIMAVQAKIGLPLPGDDEKFDEVMLDCLQYDPATSIVGTVALLYRNLWAMADMRERLKNYEDMQEQGLFAAVPVAIGETVYRINENAENQIIPMSVVSFEFKGITDTFKEIKCKELGFGGEWTYRFTDIGKTLFLTRSEAEEALAKMGGK